MALNLALRFLLEIGALISFGYWGFVIGSGYLFKSILGIGTPLAIAFIWGVYGSPGAPIKVQGINRLLLELIIFGSAALALFAAGKPMLAIIFAISVILNRLLLFVFDQ